MLSSEEEDKIEEIQEMKAEEDFADEQNDEEHESDCSQDDDGKSDFKTAVLNGTFHG